MRALSQPRRCTRSRLRATVLAALALLGVAATLPAQQPATRRTATQRDLRCLTSNPKHCLPKPVPADEPHDAVCATCHNLWEQPTLSDAAQTCATAECHARADTLTPYHRGLRAGVLENCIGCHPAHDARIPARAKGGADCAFCHTAGGSPPAWARAAPRARQVAAEQGFRHARHRDLACTSCHATRQEHGTLTVTRREECQSCHHADAATSACTSCHTRSEVGAVTRQVTRTMNLQLGSLDHPQRTRPFAHKTHEQVRCQTCHTGNGPSLAATRANCSSCHVQHHRVDAGCTTCHQQPAPGVHTRQAHLGCAGAGCHQTMPERLAQVPRTREFCLLCHQGKTDHSPEGSCADCHKLPAPRPGGQAPRR